MICSKSICCDDGCAINASQRLLYPNSVPILGTTISSIDMDLTVDCNLACDYCFKEKSKKHMSLKTAQDAIIWLIIASGDAKDIKVTLIGGEPLLRFKTIKEIVPFATRRACQHDKNIHFGMTTNGTILSKEILEFWEKWGLGFHTSIDGCPIAHDRHRHYINGKGSSRILARNLPNILTLRPNTTARATILPDTVENLVDSFEYILNLGYHDIALVPGAFPLWDEKSLSVFSNQFRVIMTRTLDLFRRGVFIRLKFFNEGIKWIANGKVSRPTAPFCGAGRGMLLVDVDGNLWPCHRWCKDNEGEWNLGSIYEGAFNYTKRSIIENVTNKSIQMPDCQTCCAKCFCVGGCPAENLEDTGSIWKRHPSGCEISKIIAELVIEFHDTLLSEKNDLFMKTYYADKEVNEVCIS